MRVVLQRVTHASVTVDSEIVGKIGKGLLLFAGFTDEDWVQPEGRSWVVDKVCNLRIFPDAGGAMNLSVEDIKGEILVVSQFTLYASVKKGRRPSFGAALESSRASELFDAFVSEIENSFSGNVAQGVFGADMKVDIENDGPVTIIVDSFQR